MKKNDRCVDILGVPVFGGTQAEVLGMIQFAMGEADRAKPMVILTPNAEQVVMAQTNDALCTSFKKADLNVPDGVGLVWASGKKLKRIAGVDLAERMIADASKYGWRVFLLGGLHGNAVRAASTLESHYTGLRVSGFGGSQNIAYESEAEKKQTIKKISDFKTDLLLVAFGAPLQERWVTESRDLLGRVGVKAVMVVGGAVDVWAGKVKRAPASWQNAGTEWLWRLLHEPWRWRRQLNLIKFVWLVWRAK